MKKKITRKSFHSRSDSFVTVHANQNKTLCMDLAAIERKGNITRQDNEEDGGGGLCCWCYCWWWVVCCGGGGGLWCCWCYWCWWVVCCGGGVGGIDGLWVSGVDGVIGGGGWCW